MTPSDPRAEYARLQQHADRRKLDAKAWAAEEQADAFLESLRSNTLKSDAESWEAWLENLATNRAKKHRRRAAMLHVYRHGRPDSESSKAHDAAVKKESLEGIRVNATAEEWSALWALAMGEDYKTVAAAECCTVSALKTRVSRCRRRLREICA